MPKYRKISVTGASGFIGKNLLQRLVDNNFAINVLDLDGGFYPEEVKVVRGNLLTKKGLDEFLQGSEVLIHLAGQVLPGNTSMDEGNVETTKNLVSKVAEHDVKKIIFSSTVAVYGSSKSKVFNELDKCNPDTEYGESKLAAEGIIENWARETKNTFTIFRFFSIYGPGNNKGVIYNLCNDFINKGVITVYGNGEQKRDLVYVEDASEILTLAVNQPLNGIYNVGTGKYYSILGIISLLEKAGAKKCKVVFKETDKSKVDEIFYSVDKLKKEANWSPKVEIEEGIKLTLASMTKNE